MSSEITQLIDSLIATPPGGRRCISVKEAVAVALERAPRHYSLTTEYAVRRYRALRAGKLTLTNTLTDALWKELMAKVEDYMRCNPKADDFAAIDHILLTDAPSRFYITPVYAEKLYYRTRRHRRRPPLSR